MLNNQKKISSIVQKKSANYLPIFTLPIVSQQAFIQVPKTTENFTFVPGLSFVLNNTITEKTSRNSCFLFSSKVFRVFSFMQIFCKKKINEKHSLKKVVFFLLQLLKYKQPYSSYFLKKIRSGFFTSAFGLNSFLPKKFANLKNILGKKQTISSLTLTQKRKKFSRKTFLKFNFVSSLKKKKNS